MIAYEAPTLETGVPVLWPPCWAETRGMRALRLDGLNRGTIWDGQATAPDPLGITAPAAGPSVATPTGGNALAGDYYCAYRYYDQTHGVYSALSALTTATAAAGDKFTITGVASGEARVTHVQFFRSTCDQNRKLYLVGTVANTGTPANTDTNSDDTLGEMAAENQLDIYYPDGTLCARRQGVPPNFLRVAVPFQDRMFMAVAAVYRVGTVAINNGSPTLTGTGTSWTSAMVGRKVAIHGAGKLYEVQAVGGATSITFTENYSGSNLSGRMYAILPDPATYNNLVAYSEVDEPESVPMTQNVFVVQENTDDHDWMTGLMPHGANLWGLKDRHVYRITFVRQPQIDVGVHLAFSRGSLNQRCWGYFEDAAYLMDALGPWSIANDQTFADIGAPIEDHWQEGLLDFGKTDWWFVATDPNRRVVKFFVTLLGQTGLRPKTAFCYSIATRRWWKETYRESLSGACRVEHLVRPRTLVAAKYDRILLLGEGHGDAVSQQGSVSAATSTTLSDSAATFTDDMVGYDVTILRGTGAGQKREISAKNSATEIAVSEAWETTPDTSSRYSVQYAVRGTATSGTGSTLVDSAKTFSAHLAGAPVALVSGTGAGQVRTIKTASASTLTVTPDWTTNPVAGTEYLVGAIEATLRTGLREIPVSDPKGPSVQQRVDERALSLTYKPTEEDIRLDLSYYPDHQESFEPVMAGLSDGPIVVGSDGKPAVKLQAAQSSLGTAPGYCRLPVRLRSAPRSVARHWLAAELHWFQAEEEVAVYGLEIEGVP